MLFAISHLLALALWLISLLLLCMKAEPWYGAFFIAAFSLFPHAVTHAMLWMQQSTPARLVLVIGMCLFGAWFLYIYADVFYWNLDPQSPVALVFIGFFSLPVMIPLWILATLLERRQRVAARKPA